MKIICCYLLSLLSLTLAAQEESTSYKPNAIYFEVLGNGVLYSVNYDRLLTTKGNLKISGRVGYSYISVNFFDEIKGSAIPIEILGWMGNKRHFEFGIGTVYHSMKQTDVSILGPTQEFDSDALYFTGRIGYRRQKPEGGFIFRAGFVPMFLVSESTSADNTGERASFIPWFGLSFGHAF